MAETFHKMAEGACPTGGLAVVYTACGKTNVMSIDISNPIDSSQLIHLQLKGRTLFHVSMPAHGGLSWRGPQAMEIGDTIAINADSSSCEYSISGVSIT